jgi:hypothetical protein
MRYAKRSALAAVVLIATSACMPSRGTEPPGASETPPATRNATVPATADERQREIERRSVSRRKAADDARVPHDVAPAQPITGEVPDAVLASMKTDLAQRLGTTVDAAIVVRAEQVIWPDGALGCGQPGGIYTQATVPGYLVEFKLAGHDHRYHGSLAGPFVYCEHPGPYLKRLGPSQ